MLSHLLATVLRVDPAALPPVPPAGTLPTCLEEIVDKQHEEGTNTSAVLRELLVLLFAADDGVMGSAMLC